MKSEFKVGDIVKVTAPVQSHNHHYYGRITVVTQHIVNTSLYRIREHENDIGLYGVLGCIDAYFLSKVDPSTLSELELIVFNLK